MSIPINVVERGEPGVKGGGDKKFYGKVSYDGEMTIDEIVKQIEKFSSLSEADIRGVIIAVENIMQDGLANGKIIRLEKLGTLYPSVSSSGANSEEEFHMGLIRKISVNYRPGKRILDAMKAAGFHKRKKK